MMPPKTDDGAGADTVEIDVRDFGPIVRAQVSLRPLTVFIGPSNTGKSYLAMLIYALHQFLSVRQFPFRMNPDGSLTIGVRSTYAMPEGSLGSILEFMRSAKETGPSPASDQFPLPSEVSEVLRAGFAKRADLLALEINRCFGISDIRSLVRKQRKTTAQVAIRHQAAGRSSPLEHLLSIGRRPALKVDVPAGLTITQDLESHTLSSAFDMLMDLPEMSTGLLDGLAWFLVAAMALRDGFGPLGSSAYYLPADRTGLMHAHGVVVGGLIASAPTADVRSSATAPVLSGVVADFLEHLLKIDVPTHDADLAGSIEQTILGGAVRVVRSPHTNYPRFTYRPDGWHEDLALSNASSMVSEVAPVVLYLRHLVSPGAVLIVEEPESHLHPAMQVEFMRQIAALVNAGVRVIVTTHSEWLLEELANIVKRSERPDRARNRVALAPEKAGVWLFESRKGRPTGTVVRELPFDDYGLSDSGMDDVATALHNEWAELSSENPP